MEEISKKLKTRFEDETGKNAIWNEKPTKQFIQWKNERYSSFRILGHEFNLKKKIIWAVQEVYSILMICMMLFAVFLGWLILLIEGIMLINLGIIMIFYLFFIIMAIISIISKIFLIISFIIEAYDGSHVYGDIGIGVCLYIDVIPFYILQILFFIIIGYH
ncbi:MAG: hypothetical protein ACFFAO_15525 [Candidatus Hermodarchaeota archaeon]